MLTCQRFPPSLSCEEWRCAGSAGAPSSTPARHVEVAGDTLACLGASHSIYQSERGRFSAPHLQRLQRISELPGFSGSLEPRSPLTSDLVPEPVGTHPERAGTYPEHIRTYPEHTDTYLEHVGTYPEHAGTYPERGGTHPERIGRYPERIGTHPER